MEVFVFFFQSTYCELVGTETKHPIFVQPLTDVFVLCITASSFSISCLAFDKSQQQHFCSEEEEAPFMFFSRNALDRSKGVHKITRLYVFAFFFFYMLDLSISGLYLKPFKPLTSRLLPSHQHPHRPHHTTRTSSTSPPILPISLSLQFAQFAPLPSQPPPVSTPTIISVAIC